jgi:hypothetical protein
MSLSIRPTSRAAGKEGREPDRNVLMYLRTGSAGPTQPAARIVGRRRLRELREVGYVFGVSVTFCATTTGSPPKVGNFQRIAAV